MVTPDQVPNLPDENDVQQRAIESFVDARLRAGERKISSPRTGWKPANVEAVMNKYRAAGWKVTGIGPWCFST